MRQIETVVHRIFHSTSLVVEWVAEGGSTFVYRIAFEGKTFYLRVWPEEGESFAPEVAIHAYLSQRQIKVPEVIYFEQRNDLLQRSIAVTTEIKGQPLSQSSTLPNGEREKVLEKAGRDLACINSVRIEGFGWVQRESPETKHLRAEWPTYRAFAFEYWEADLAYLVKSYLSTSEVEMLERVASQFSYYFNIEQGYLAHGDFDSTHIYQAHGCYTGIIDFGEIRGTDRWYDLAHFHLRDGQQLPYRLEAALVRGYGEIIPIPADYEQHIRFTSVLINVRALAGSLQKRPPNRTTQHQVEVLREDLAFLL